MANFGNMADLMIEGVADAGGGGIQRWAWDQTENIGMINTGLFIVGGLVLPMFMRNQLVDVMAKGMFHSGATVAGWIATEKVFNLGTRAGQPTFVPHGARPQLSRGRYFPAMDGARAPEVAIAGRNPNTGEEILDSRI